MKRYFKLLFIALCAVVVTAAPAFAENFFASDISGASMTDKIVTVDENDAEIVYEWFTESSGEYSVSFKDAVSSACDISMSINEGYDIKIDDITKPITVGFDAGINKIVLKIRKINTTSSFSVGTLELTYIDSIDTDTIHIEVNKDSYTHITSGYIYYENYGSDMSDGDVILLQKSTVPEVSFIVYAPVSGEYSMTAAMSHLGQSFTSDVNMTVNGTIYPLTANTMKKVADLTNASDKGLMKRFKKKNTITLKEGMNTVTFSAIEKRNAGDIYIYFLDCVDFSFVNEDVIDVAENINAPGEYTYTVIPANNAEYALEFTASSKDMAHNLPDCSISVDGGASVKLVKGETVNVISEYSEDGYLYGRYRLNDNISIQSTLLFKLESADTIIEKISLVPAISGLNEVFAKSGKVFLQPGEKTDISVFATDEEGYALNFDYLRKNGGVTYKSSDREILAADALGSIVALKPGIAHITVAASDGDNVRTSEAELNVYNEEYGFTILSAEKDTEFVKVRLLSPFGTKETGHQMIIAEFSESEDMLKNVAIYDINNLAKGQIVTCKMPASENLFKVISLDSFSTMKSAYEVVAVKEE